MRALIAASLLALAGCGSQPAPAPGLEAADPLPSWNDGRTKTAIVDFVRATTNAGSPDLVPAAERIAVFDNDGTLWAEQPAYVQLMFVLDRIGAMAPSHPEWTTKEPFKSALAGDMKALSAQGETAVAQLLMATHTGVAVDEFAEIVRAWIASARHPLTKRPCTSMVYQPMLEVLAYLRANGFKTYIVSGGGAQFIRAWAEQTYGIPPEHVIGSRVKLKYDVANGRSSVVQLPEIDLVDDGPGKPVGIAQMIGRRPIAAFGNSDGDFQMLEYTTSGAGKRLGVIVHHTDAEREWAYDRGSHIGKLERGLDEADARGWILADIKRDWKVVYPPKQETK